VIIDRLGKNIHPGDEVRITGSPAALRRVNLNNHFCVVCKVEDVRPHPDPRGETSVKLTCGYVAPITLLRFVKCPHVARVPPVHAFIDFKVVCGIELKHSTRFSAREDHWTCKKCIVKMRRSAS